MVISRKYKFLFIHIAKNAGTTVSGRLQSILDSEQDSFIDKGNVRPSNFDDIGFNPQKRIVKHSGVADLRDALGVELYDSFHSFAFVRNPYARFFSAFHFAKRKAVEYWDQPEITPYRRRFRDYSIEDSIPALETHARKTWAFRPQNSFVPNPKSVTWVGRFEHLDRDLEQLVANLDLPKLRKYNKDSGNRQPKNAWRSMPDRVKAAVAEFYEDDFKLFGYNPADHHPLETENKLNAT